MCVGAADPERAHPGPKHAVPLPRAVLALHDEWTLVEPQLGVRAGVVQCRGDRLVLQAQDRLDQARDSGRDFQVADVRLDRSQYARARPWRFGDLECRSQPLDFDGVTQRGAGTVALDIADGRGVDAGHRMGFGDDVGLGGRIRCRVAHFRRSVVVDRRPADDGVNAVAGVDGGLQRLERHHRHTAAEDGAVGANIEGPAVADRRHHRSRRVPVADAVRDAQRRPAGQGHVAFAGQQAQAGQVHGDQRGRACGLDRDAGAAQVERMRYPRCQEILVVLQEQAELVEVEPLGQYGVRVAMRQQVV